MSDFFIVIRRQLSNVFPLHIVRSIYLFTLILILALGALSAPVLGHAESPLILITAASDVAASSGVTLPLIMTHREDPYSGEIRISGNQDGAATTSPEQWLGWEISVTSMLDQTVVGRCEIKPPSSDEVATFQLPSVLAEGVYELRLTSPTSVTSRFRDLLPWERGHTKERGLGATAVSTASWTLIVLPKRSSEMSRVNADDNEYGESLTPRSFLVRWFGFRHTLEHVSSRTGVSGVTARISRMLSNTEHETTSPAKRWADAMKQLDRRLDAIAVAGAEGIVVDDTVFQKSFVDDAASLTTEDEREALMMRCLIAKADRLGLQTWYVHSATLPSTEQTTQPDPTKKTLVAIDSWPPKVEVATNESTEKHPSRRLTVASFTRPSAEMIRGHFPPAIHAAEDSDLLWFGAEPRRSHVTDEALSSSVTTPASVSKSPLADVDKSFIAQAWLADWSLWCTRHAVNNDQHGLIVDETLLLDEESTQSARIRNALQAWQVCWAEPSVWIDEAPGSDGKPSSLVRVRHIHRGPSTTLVCFNHSPWPMRVTFPLANFVTWDSQDTDVTQSLELMQPNVTELGSVIVIPALSQVVCQCTQRIAPAIQFTAEMDDARMRLAELTTQVTTIVENLGLLSELAGITSLPKYPVHLLENQANGHESEASASSAGRPTTWRSEAFRMASWGSSAWSSDRKQDANSSTTGEPATTSGQAIASGKSTAVDRLGEISSAATDRTNRPTTSQCRNLLSNGGFEMPLDISIPGWMHAQHPTNAVAIDRLVYSEGHCSIRMSGKTDSGASSWLISREIATPLAGRIGVSMSLRGEPLEAENVNGPKVEQTPEVISIRIAIEGERDGSPIRHTETITVPNDGKWQTGQLALEWLDVDPVRDQNLRITIDNFSSQAVWIDNVVVTDYFASLTERSELQSLAYLAVQGLQRSEWKPAAVLLKNFWARDLLRVAEQTRISTLPQMVVPSSDTKTRFPIGGINLPGAMWAESSEAVPPVIPLSPNASSLQRPKIDGASVSPPSNVPASGPVSENKPAPPTAPPTDPQPPASIAGRLRSWLPSPLRF